MLVFIFLLSSSAHASSAPPYIVFRLFRVLFFLAFFFDRVDSGKTIARGTDASANTRKKTRRIPRYFLDSPSILVPRATRFICQLVSSRKKYISGTSALHMNILCYLIRTVYKLTAKARQDSPLGSVCVYLTILKVFKVYTKVLCYSNIK